MSAREKQAYDIATKELRLCYKDCGILAGTHHFTDYWARDGYFAALGSLALGDNKIVEKMIDFFYGHQNSDGLIPYRIMRGPISLSKYLGSPPLHKTPKPTYKLRDVGTKVLDGTILTILFTAILGLKNNNEIKKHIPKAKKALGYLKTREKNGLLYDGLMAEWNDLALKWGYILYTNIIYWYMYDRLSAWTKTIQPEWHQILKRKSELIANALRNKLWSGSFFSDWYDFKRQDYFYPFGNCMAIAWGLTNSKESELILNQCKKISIDFTIETNVPRYPFWRIDPLQRLIGMGDYQNMSLLWWQPVLSYLAALKKTQKDKRAKEVTKKIVAKVCTDKTIYECYERNGLPVKRFLYSSEHPFAWSSGMFIWALSL